MPGNNSMMTDHQGEREQWKNNSRNYKCFREHPWTYRHQTPTWGYDSNKKSNYQYSYPLPIQQKNFHHRRIPRPCHQQSATYQVESYLTQNNNSDYHSYPCRSHFHTQRKVGQHIIKDSASITNHQNSPGFYALDRWNTWNITMLSCNFCKNNFSPFIIVMIEEYIRTNLIIS